MANIQIQYYNGSGYVSLYPVINLNNNDGTALSSSYIPNLGASKITSRTFAIARMPSYVVKGIQGGYTGTGSSSISISTGFRTHMCMLGGSNFLCYGIYSTSTATIPGVAMIGYQSDSNYGTCDTQSITFSVSSSLIKIAPRFSGKEFILSISRATYYYLALAVI